MEQQTTFRGAGIRDADWKVAKQDLNFLLINGNRVYAEGLNLLLEQSNSPDYKFQIVCNSKPEKILGLADPEQIRQYHNWLDFDVILLTTQTANFALTLQLALCLRNTWLDKPILWLDMPDDVQKIVSCISSGANGFVMQEDSSENLIEALVVVAQGGRYCTVKALPSIFSHLTLVESINKPALPTPTLADFDLTARELEVLTGLGRGLDNRRIGLELCIEIRTVKNHVHNILRKLQVPNRQEALRLAVRYRIV